MNTKPKQMIPKLRLKSTKDGKIVSIIRNDYNLDRQSVNQVIRDARELGLRSVIISGFDVNGEPKMFRSRMDHASLITLIDNCNVMKNDFY